MSFVLCRGTLEMSIPQFTVATSYYTEEEVLTPEFLTSIWGYILRAQTDREFWLTMAQLGQSCTVVESSIRDPTHCYLHRVVACPLVGRHSGNEKCSNADLICMISMLTSREANIATLLLASFSQSRS